ncbi:MAG: acyl-CoA--6-aminopenicillanic acid acyl-transferase, partial [Bacteroidota bacterium]|nr:acyl-CoA--6-aminopenicillanic acid acyl-transferase [Bacteroidota bacterium]
LKEVFKKFENGNVSQSLASAAETLPKSPFLETEEFQDYEHYRKLEQQVKIQLENEETISEETGEKLIALNPEFWEAYFLAGKMAYEQKNFSQALRYFEQARTKVVTTKPDLEQLDKMIRKTKRRL